MATLTVVMERLEKNLGRVPTQDEIVKALTVEIIKLETKQKAGELTFTVSAKKAVSVYGLGKWPVTLYRSQWEKLFEQMQALMDFIELNKAELAEKDKAEAPAAA